MDRLIPYGALRNGETYLSLETIKVHTANTFPHAHTRCCVPPRITSASASFPFQFPYVISDVEQIILYAYCGSCANGWGWPGKRATSLGQVCA